MRKRFYRSRDEKVVAGVCGGLAVYFNMDPTLVRLAVVLLVLATVLGSKAAYAADISRDKIVTVYILRLAEHIQWANEAAISEYRIHLIDEEQGVANQLKGLAKIKKLHGKPFRVTLSSSASIPSDAHVVFVSSNTTDLYAGVFKQVEGKNLLLISDNLDDKRFVMINLVEKNAETISFEINKANILNQNLGVQPDIILLGGTEIDVARLYREGQS